MKKTFAILLALMLMVSFTLTGCGGQSEPVQEPAAEPAESTEPVAEQEEMEAEAPAEKITVNFAVQADSTSALDEIVSAFNAQSEKFEVEAIVMTNDSGNMHDQLMNSLSSKSGEYDIISMDVVWAGEFAAAGYLEPIDSIIRDAGWKVTDFNAGSMASGKYKGKNYVLPYFSDLGFLYYRTDIVSDEDAAKLEAGDYTWTDLLAMAEGYAGQGETTYGHVYQSKQYEGLTCNLNEFTANWSDVQGGLEMMKAFTQCFSKWRNCICEKLAIYEWYGCKWRVSCYS
jgi:multiple sugar transport system substrate-binding protein